MLLRFLLLFVLLILSDTLLAQSKRDFITHHYDSLSKIKLSELDSSSSRTNKKIDSVQQRINNVLNPDLSKLSLRKGKSRLIEQKSKRDSIEFYKALKASKDKLKIEIDSLEKVGMSSQLLTKQLDSLNKVKYMPVTDSSTIKFNTTRLKIDKQRKNVNTILNPDLKSLSYSGQSTLQRRKTKRDSLAFIKTVESQKSRIEIQLDSARKAGGSIERFTLQLDSLTKLKYSPGSNKDPLLTRKLDSIRSINPTQQLSKAQQEIDGVGQKITAPANKIENGINEKLSLMKKEGGEGVNIPANLSTSKDVLPSTKLPEASLPNASLPSADLKLDNPLKDQMGDAGEVKEKIMEVQNLPQQEIGKLKSTNEVKEAQDKLGVANQITDKVQSYSGEVKSIAKGDLKEAKELPKVAEERAGQLGMNDLQKQTGQFDQYKEITEKAKDPDALKEEALKQAPKIAVNHFAGKEAMLQAAMDKMSKLKSKYGTLNSLADAPKHSRNTMRGNPFIERLLPGINLQFQKNDDFLLDYNPYIGYRFYGRFTAGAGWNERIGIGKYVHVSLKQRIYGPRVYADFHIGKGFSIRTDIEKMNTFVPSLTGSGYSTSDGYRAWVWSAFIGIRKQYKLVNRVKGTAQFLYNLYDDHNNSPYSDRIAVRMGFEIQMKKKLRVTGNNSLK